MQDKSWRILESRYIIQRPWLTARCDKVQLPDGRINPEHYVLEYPAWVNVIAITTTGEFVMIRQYRHGLQRTSYELAAGAAEPGEAPEAAARRELLEETGYSGGQWQLWLTIGQNPSTCSNLTYCFLATGVAKTAAQQLDSGEDIDVHLLSGPQVHTLLTSGEIVQALMAAPLWKLAAQQPALLATKKGLCQNDH